MKTERQSEKTEKNTKNGYIFCIIGKSAVGKDTLYRELKKQCPALKTCVLYTTRPPRDGEKGGVSYHFTSEAQLSAYEKAGKLIEQRRYETVQGPWIYATIDDGQIRLREASYLMQATLASYEKLRAYYGAAAVIPLYIEADDLTRIRRSIDRESRQHAPNIKEVCRRYLADELDFSEEKLLAAGIRKRYRNEKKEQCIHALLETIHAYLDGKIRDGDEAR